MHSSTGSQTETRTSRILIESVEREFALLDERARGLLQRVPVAVLYKTTMPSAPGATSIGDALVRSAGAVEQIFGGLNANLWDDPFEWTLPETLSTPSLLTEYLDEVTAAQNEFFARLKEDQELTKLVAIPSGETRPLIQLLRETLVRATGHLERAAAMVERIETLNH